jgi:hypothetical protein
MRRERRRVDIWIRDGQVIVLSIRRAKAVGDGAARGRKAGHARMG